MYFHHTTELRPRTANFSIHSHEECELLYFMAENAQRLVEPTGICLKTCPWKP